MIAITHKPVAIITGAGGGIGRATATELAACGYQLVLCGRSIETLNQTAAAIHAAKVITLDVSSPAQVQKMVAQVKADYGRIDLLVNNAGTAPQLDLENTSIEQWHAVLNTNLSAAFYLTKAVWPIFRKQQNGVVINISSIAAKDPFPGFAAYAASKAGLNGLSLSLAREGATMGVRVYTIAPGAVETSLLRTLVSVEQLPTNQTLCPSQIAKVISQCAAGEGGYTCGEVIWLPS